MKPTQLMIDEIYREKVERARRMSLARRVEVGAELSDLGRQMMRETILAAEPAATEEQIRRIMRERIALSRRLDDLPLPQLDESDSTENGA